MDIRCFSFITVNKTLYIYNQYYNYIIFHDNKNISRIRRTQKRKIICLNDTVKDVVCLSLNKYSYIKKYINEVFKIDEVKFLNVKRIFKVENCTICLIRPSEYINIPCGHQVYCDNCMELLVSLNIDLDGSCYVCKEKISYTLTP